MTKLLTPASSKFLLLPHEMDLHTEAIGWLSELEFYKTELNFFKKLFDKYSLKISTSLKRTDLVRLEKKVNSIQKMAFIVRSEIIRHEKNLSLLDEDEFLLEQKSVKKEHEKVSKHLKSFEKSIKSIKLEVFDFIEKQIKVERN